MSDPNLEAKPDLEDLDPTPRMEEGEPELEVLRMNYDPLPEDPDEKLPEEHRGKSKEDLIREMEEIKKQQQEISGKADANVALRESIAQLGETLSQQNRGVSSAQQIDPSRIQEMRQKQIEELRKDMQEKFFDDPITVLDKYNELKTAPIVEQLLTKNIPVARKLAELDPKTSSTMSKYGDEVDRIVAGLSPAQRLDPDVYAKAAKMVRAEHLEEEVNDIVSQKVAEELAKQTGGGKQNAQQGSQVDNYQSSRPFSEGGMNNRPPTRKPKYPWTPEDQRIVDTRGLRKSDYVRSKYGIEIDDE